MSAQDAIDLLSHLVTKTGDRLESLFKAKGRAPLMRLLWVEMLRLSIALFGLVVVEGCTTSNPRNEAMRPWDCPTKWDLEYVPGWGYDPLTYHWDRDYP